MKNIFIFVCLIAVGLVTKAQTYPYCKAGLFSEQTYYSDISITHDLNVVYGSNLTFQGNPIDLALDLHYPNLIIDPLPLRPTIILLHGGGFTSGSKSDMTNYCVKLARAGYVAVSVDYRLGWDAIGGGGSCNGNIPQLKYAIYRAIQDVNASIRFLIEKASDYRIDTSSIFLVGQSEGGMTAIHCAYMNQVEADTLLAGASADLGKIDSATNTYFHTYHLKGIVNWCGTALDTNMIAIDQPTLTVHTWFI
ncbi:MAG: alpha/beta hydrolase [Bacteroidetes bacterium]|nr:alpha/beta hydrolase [Bacteroidota bacterium]